MNQPAHYQWDAHDYARHSAAQFAWALELIDKLALRGDERLLDIGCGDGKVSAALARQVPRGRVVGVDSSPDMIRLAQRTFPPESHPNLTFRLLDAQTLDYERAFEAAFSNAVLHWVPDQRAVLAGVRRALRERGRLLFQMGGTGNGRDIYAAFDVVAARPAWQPYFTGFAFPYYFHGPEPYERWLIEAGLKPVRVELIPKDMVHEGATGLVAWLRTAWLPYVERVPADRRAAWLDEVVRTYLAAHPLDAEGRAHVAMVRLEVEAVRG